MTARSLADTARDRAARAAKSVWHDATDLGQFALGLIGVRYRYGGETPAGGLDCSGLIRYVFQQVTGVTLPRTARELSQVGANVSLDDLQVGDLVFFNTRNYAFSHVGLYLGDDRFIHFPGGKGLITRLDKLVAALGGAARAGRSANDEGSH